MRLPIFSIKKRYVDHMLPLQPGAGTPPGKYVELRTVIPKGLTHGDIIFINETGKGGARQVVGELQVNGVIEISPGDLAAQNTTQAEWLLDLCQHGIKGLNGSEFLTYFKGKPKGYAVIFHRSMRYRIKLPLCLLGHDKSPQNFCYTKPDYPCFPILTPAPKLGGASCMACGWYGGGNEVIWMPGHRRNLICPRCHGVDIEGVNNAMLYRL